MIDLHTHTNHSDGTDSVEKLLLNAEKKKLEIISITDHDSVDAYYELENNPNLRKLFSGKILPGCEMKTHYKKVPIEVLAYGIDYKKLNIHKADIDKMQIDVLEKYKVICDELGLKYDKEELYVDKNNPKKQWASFSLANELLKYEENKEIIKEIGDFIPTTFYRVHQSNVNSPFYYDETVASIDLNETIKRIHEAGGLAFLAHGFVYPYENKIEVLDEILKTTEIDGLECVYTLFSKEEIKIAFDLCKKYNKYSSGGSDYHAKNKPTVELGIGESNIIVTKDIIKEWLDESKLM